MQMDDDHIHNFRAQKEKEKLEKEHAASIREKKRLLDILPGIWRVHYEDAAAVLQQQRSKKRKVLAPKLPSFGTSVDALSLEGLIPVVPLPPEQAATARARRMEEIWRMCSNILLRKLWQVNLKIRPKTHTP
jgi:hypothetical protein